MTDDELWQLADGLSVLLAAATLAYVIGRAAAAGVRDALR